MDCCFAKWFLNSSSVKVGGRLLTNMREDAMGNESSVVAWPQRKKRVKVRASSKGRQKNLGELLGKGSEGSARRQRQGQLSAWTFEHSEAHSNHKRGKSKDCRDQTHSSQHPHSLSTSKVWNQFPKPPIRHVERKVREARGCALQYPWNLLKSYKLIRPRVAQIKSADMVWLSSSRSATFC